MDWKAVDERLIRRGELILDLESLGNHEKELENMNKGRPGPRYKIATSYINLLAIVRYLFQMPYRQLEGFTRALHKLVPQLPSGDYSGLRKRSLPQDLAETIDWYIGLTSFGDGGASREEQASAFIVHVLRDWLRMEAAEPSTATEWIRAELKERVEQWS